MTNVPPEAQLNDAFDYMTKYQHASVGDISV
jgi:hypothetical protein